MEEDIIKHFEELKRNKDIIDNIDKDFFFKFAENLIARNKELEVINKMQEYRINVIDEREFIPKSKVRDKIEKIDKILCRNFLVDKLRDYFTAKKEVLEELLQGGYK